MEDFEFAPISGGNTLWTSVTKTHRVETKERKTFFEQIRNYEEPFAEQICFFYKGNE